MSKLVALIIGATGCIGSELAVNFAKRGYTLVIHGRNLEKLNSLEQRLSTYKVPILKYCFDVLHVKQMFAAIADAAEKCNGIDILICAQGYFSAPLLEDKISTAEIEKVIDINYKASVFATRAVVPTLGSRGQGLILYFSSHTTTQLGFPGLHSYVSAKAALPPFAKSVLEEVRHKNVKVTALYPNIVNSTIGHQIDAYFGHYHSITTEEMLQPSDICHTVNYVLDQSKYACTSDIYLTAMKQNLVTLEMFTDKRPLPPPPLKIDPSKKVCYVTGASKGIGRTCAVRMAQRGYDLALVARSMDQLQETAALCKVHNVRVECFSVDVTNIDALEKSIYNTVELLGNINVVINNAGINKRKSAVNAPRDLWNNVIDTNFTSAIHAVRSSLPFILQNQPFSNCAIVFISSAVVLQPGQAGVAPYYATKHGINGFVGSLLEDVRHLGVKVTTVCPGLVNTDIGTKKGPVELFPPEQLIQTDDCADAISYVLDSSEKCCPYRILIHPQHGSSPVSNQIFAKLHSAL